MAKLALLLLVFLVRVVVESEADRQLSWNFTTELEEKAENWQENSTHVVITKPLPLGFDEAYWSTHPSPCIWNLSCSSCLELSPCAYYSTLNGNAYFCGKKGFHLGCDYDLNLRRIETLESCIKEGYMNKSVAMWKRKYECNPQDRCLQCMRKKSCRYFVTYDYNYAFCAPKNAHAKSPVPIVAVNETDECYLYDMDPRPEPEYRVGEMETIVVMTSWVAVGVSVLLMVYVCLVPPRRPLTDFEENVSLRRVPTIDNLDEISLSAASYPIANSDNPSTTSSTSRPLSFVADSKIN